MSEGGTGPVEVDGTYEHLGADIIASVREETVGYEGMKIDRMLFEKFGDTVRKDETLSDAVMAGQWDRVIDYVNREVFDKPEEYYTLNKLRQAAAVDRRLTLREILEKVFGLIPDFKSKDELLEEEFAKFVADCKPGRGGCHPGCQELLQSLCHQQPGTRHHRRQSDSPSLPPTRLFPPATSPPCRTSTATSFRNTSRTTFP